jgi:hypothetical protein
MRDILTKEQLLEAGYEELGYDYRRCDHYYQKRIYNDDKYVLYIIKVGMWDFHRIDTTGGIHYECYVNLYRGNQEFTITYTVNDSDTVQTIEAFFSEIFSKLNCVPDIHNNGFSEFFAKRRQQS